MRDGRFEIETSQDTNRALLTAKGEIDLATVDRLEEALDDAVRRGAEEVWLDLTQVGFMDSTGLTALVSGHLALAGRLLVICPEGAVRRTLDVSGLDGLIRIRRSLTEAA